HDLPSSLAPVAIDTKRGAPAVATIGKLLVNVFDAFLSGTSDESRALGTVPELRLLALRLVSPEPLPLTVPLIVPLTVTLLLNVAAPPTANVPEMSALPL